MCICHTLRDTAHTLNVVTHIQRVEERVKLPPKVRLEAVKLPG